MVTQPFHLAIGRDLSSTRYRSQGGHGGYHQRRGSRSYGGYARLIGPRIFGDGLIRGFRGRASSAVLPSLVIVVLSTYFTVSELYMVVVAIYPWL